MPPRDRVLLVAAILLSTVGLTPAHAQPTAESWSTCRTRPLPGGTAEELGIDGSLAGDLDALLRDAVAGGQAESAAALVARRGKVFFRGSAGSARTDSIFDLASVTKVVATTTAVMRLVEERKRGVALGTAVGSHVPWAAGTDKRGISVEQLLLHTSGLPSVVWRGKETDGRQVILSRIQAAKMEAPPGRRYRYSDVGFILLGELVHRLSGEPLHRFVHREVFVPLGMCDTGFTPPQRLLKRVISPWPDGGKRGQVYDPLAARMAGVAGHAGLYSTVDDLARFGQAMLSQGKLEGGRMLRQHTVRSMLHPRALPGKRRRRALGWGLNSPPDGSTRKLSPAAFGHNGFTGTSLWIDPRHQLVIVLLTNRTRLTPAPRPATLRSRLFGLVLGAIQRHPGRAVETGLDRLAADGFRALRGKRVALITNRTAVDRKGRWIVDLMLDAAEANVQLGALFVPEHGLRARLDRHLKDSSLSRGGRRIPVYSLFGRRRRPTDRTLQGINAIVFDVAAVGVRYYTYIATMGWAMEEAAQRGLPFVVLDRPNPIDGRMVQGPVAEDPRRTSTNYHPLPVRYGMTMGELAGLLNRERRIGARLEVVPMRGWARRWRFNELGLPWVDPSPNIRSWRQALLYGGVGLLEGTNLSVGRGTDAPFLVVGAPWIDGRALAAELNRSGVRGVHAVPTRFTPRASRYKGVDCTGARLLLIDPDALNPPALGIALALALRKLHPARWKPDKLYRLIRHPPTTRAILRDKGLEAILDLWTPSQRKFERARRRHLLYK
jgi:uncharacterized protein YbbC (DUF1343 family)